MTDVSKYPAITIPSALPLPALPHSQDQIIPHLRSLHGVLSAMQASTARAFDVLNFFRIMMPPPGDGLTDMPAASGSGAVYFDRDSGRVFFDPVVSGAPSWVEVAYAPGDIDDSDIDLSGTHAALLSGASTVADAMTILDDLDGADIVLGFTPTGWLFGQTLVSGALSTIDAYKTNGFILSNDVPIKWTDSRGTGTLNVLKLNSADQLESLQEVIAQNNDSYYGKTTGGTARNIGKVNSSDEIDIGDANLPLNLNASGTIDAGANDIETTGDIDCANTIAPFDRALKTTTLTDNVGITFLKLPLDSGKATSCEVYWEVEATNGTAVEFASGNARFSVYRLAAGTTVSTPVEFGRDNGLIGSMTVVIASSSASAFEGRMTITANTSLSGATITLRVRATSGSPTQPVWNF